MDKSKPRRNKIKKRQMPERVNRLAAQNPARLNLTEEEENLGVKDVLKEAEELFGPTETPPTSRVQLQNDTTKPLNATDVSRPGSKEDFMADKLLQSKK